MMKRFWGMVRTEYRMAMNRPGFWITFGLLALLYGVLPYVNSDYSFLVTAETVWRQAGRLVFETNVLVPVVVGIALADRLVRDDRLGVNELLRSTPLSRRAYILAKYVGNLLSVLTPALVMVLIPSIYLAVTLGLPQMILMTLAAYMIFIVPAYAFVAAFSLACPLVIPLRVYQVLFTGYWIWGNWLNPEAFPTLAGTWLTPGGLLAYDTFFADLPPEAQLYTPTDVALNFALLALCAGLALFAAGRFMAHRAQQA
ncbi:MAG TPA: ABC transporter permease [Chloroflexi bacterium]|jgi:ABC-2 type transport system permease protein|nr:ABC transporter permease [Chloroflexota bacterium]